MKIKNAVIENYKTYLKEPYRPPSRGGNTKALHSHVLTINGEAYSFLASGAKQWVYKIDKVSFDYEINNGYKNIKKETIVTIDKSGKEVIRGNRIYRDTLRTAISRMPVSRREMK